MGSCDLVVAGGGVIGQAVAWYAADAGLSVTVVDPAPGRGASWAAAGMLAPVAEATFREEPLLRANLASSGRWPTFAASLEAAAQMPIGYVRCGTLLVAQDNDEAAELDRLVSFREQLGLGVSRLRGREARQLEPALATGIRMAVACPDDHQVDNRAVIEALGRATRRSGVTFVRKAADAVVIRGGRTAGVGLSDGSIVEGRQVVLAAGAASGALPIHGTHWRPPAVRPVKGQLLHLRVPDGYPPLTARTVRRLGTYVVSRPDGRVVLGATVEEQGFDQRVTAGGAYELLRAAYEILPGIVECELVESLAGLRPATLDNAPVIGPTGPPGLIVATGHYRNGMLLAPLTAEAVVAVLQGEDMPPELQPLGPARFERVEAGA